ncbi:methyl-accepting chemotaxis protein, partial [Burkholderia pseudomallei]|uniref:methyl-accepting chemotaxis protein n=1 Tax=Burkholderia pseudomallei TaxID=28450 RepID=UPI0021F73468
HATAQKIVEIIVVIYGIAFQTNFLSLNAAVAASPPAEQGRAFAFVPSALPSLAHLSATSSRDIQELIACSVFHVVAGHLLSTAPCASFLSARPRSRALVAAFLLSFFFIVPVPFSFISVSCVDLLFFFPVVLRLFGLTPSLLLRGSAESLHSHAPVLLSSHVVVTLLLLPHSFS